MGGLSSWDAYTKYVEGGMKDGQFVSGQFVFIGAGPPHLANLGGASALGGQTDVVYPIGVTQNVAVSSNKSIARIFEIGSERSYFIPSRTIGQLTLARVWYHGASLLRVLWAYYNDQLGDVTIDTMLEPNNSVSLFPYASGSTGTLNRPHNVRIPPGYDNVFLNLASDLFNQPIGLMLLIRDSEQQNLGAVYLEQCYVPTHTWATDSQGLIIQESVGIQFERFVPIKVNAISLVSGLLASDNPFTQNEAEIPETGSNF